MALGTQEYAPAPRQQPSPGVGMQGAPPVVAPPEPARPVLFDDIDPVLLVRLYPAARDAAEMRAQAMEAGERAYDEGLKLVASQQEPVVGAGGEPVEPPPPAY